MEMAWLSSVMTANAEHKTRDVNHQDVTHVTFIIQERVCLSLASLTRISSYRKQLVKYEWCFSVLLYNNNPHRRWVSRDCTKMTYWGGTFVSSTVFSRLNARGRLFEQGTGLCEARPLFIKWIFSLFLSSALKVYWVKSQISTKT